MKRLQSIRKGAALAAVAALCALPFSAIAAQDHKVTICHATSSATNPYVRIVVDEHATNGHFDNNGTPLSGHEDDILLQGDVDCPGGTSGGGGSQHDKITICHATGSATNPYVRIVVDANATNGHFDNNGTPLSGHEDDILLQGDVDCPGSGSGGGGGNAPETGALIVIKNVVNDNGATGAPSDFSIGVTSATSGTNVANSPAPGSSSGTTYILSPGTYTVTELTASSTYAATFSGSCTANGSVVVTKNATSTCTITNNDVDQGGGNNGGGGRTGTLIVRKVVVNDNGGTATSSSFQISVKNASSTNVAGSPSAGSFAGTSFSLLPGTYTVSEATSSAYAGSFSGACNSSGSVSISAGATSTCVITNNDIATSTGGGNNGGGGGTCMNDCGLGLLTIIKHALGGNANFSFTISGATNATTSITTVGGIGTAIVPLLHFGTTTISESALAGWSMTGISCMQNGFAAGTTTNAGFTFNVHPLGEVVVCDIYNATSTATSTPNTGGGGGGGGGGTSTSTPPATNGGGGGQGGGGGSPGGGGSGSSGGGGNGPIVGSLGGGGNGPVLGGGGFSPGQVLGAATSIPEGMGGYVPGVPNTGAGGMAVAYLILLIASAATVAAGLGSLRFR